MEFSVATDVYWLNFQRHKSKFFIILYNCFDKSVSFITRWKQFTEDFCFKILNREHGIKAKAVIFQRHINEDLLESEMV